MENIIDYDLEYDHEDESKNSGEVIVGGKKKFREIRYKPINIGLTKREMEFNKLLFEPLLDKAKV